MSERTKPFVIGLFFIVGTAIGIGGLIWLGSSKWFKETQTFVTYFDYTVQGLNLDAPVKFRGVQVGRVKDINVAPDGVLIEVVMELNPVLDVSDSLRAGLELTGITGLRYIELDVAGPEQLEMHPTLKFNPPYRVIPSQPGGFEEIEQALRDVYDKFSNVYEKIRVIDTQGISDRSKFLLESGAQMTQAADSLLRDRSLTAWTRKLGGTIDGVDSSLKHLDFAYYDEEAAKALQDIRSGAQRFDRLMAELENQAGGLKVDERMTQTFNLLNDLILSSSEVINRFNYNSAQLMSSVGATLTALNQTIAELNSLVTSMEAYPSNVFYAAPPPEEK